MLSKSVLSIYRIAVIGCPGSGKTTLANNLGKILNRPVVHLDKVLWNPNWEMLPYEQRVIIHNELINGDNWLIDGMWRSHLEDRFVRATTVIFLDYKRRVSLFRALKRRRKYAGKQRDDIADGCLEKLDKDFLQYIWNFRKQTRPLICKLINSNPQITTVTLSTPKQASCFLKAVKNRRCNKRKRIFAVVVENGGCTANTKINASHSVCLRDAF